MTRARNTTQTGVPDGRLCAGSTKFGIPQHRAPVADFPVQPSGKDGLGRMCRAHWTEYTGALRRAANKRKGIEPTPAREKPGRAPRAAAAPTAPRAPRTPRAATSGVEVTAARATIAAADKLGGRAYLDAIASDEMQAALQVLAGTREGPEVHEALRTRMYAEQLVAADVPGPREGEGETPLGQDIDGDAAGLVA